MLCAISAAYHAVDGEECKHKKIPICFIDT
jgi:hypothetical protein